MALEERSDLAKVSASTLAAVPSQYNSPQGRLGRRVGSRERHGLQHRQLAKADVPTSVMDLADKKWKGKLALAPTETDFLPIVTSIELAYGQGGGRDVAARGEGERGSGTSIPTTRRW